MALILFESNIVLSLAQSLLMYMSKDSLGKVGWIILHSLTFWPLMSISLSMSFPLRTKQFTFFIVSSTLSFIKKSQCPIMSRGRPLASIIFLGLVNLLIFNLLSFATSQPMMQTEAPVSNKNCSCDWFDLKFVFLLMSPWTVLSESFASFILSSKLITSVSVYVGWWVLAKTQVTDG